MRGRGHWPAGAQRPPPHGAHLPHRRAPPPPPHPKPGARPRTHPVARLRRELGAAAAGGAGTSRGRRTIGATALQPRRGPRSQGHPAPRAAWRRGIARAHPPPRLPRSPGRVRHRARDRPTARSPGPRNRRIRWQLSQNSVGGTGAGRVRRGACRRRPHPPPRAGRDRVARGGGRRRPPARVPREATRRASRTPVRREGPRR